MTEITLVGEWLAESFLSLWDAIGTWGVIGVGIIAPTVIYKIVSIFKRILKN